MNMMMAAMDGMDEGMADMEGVDDGMAAGGMGGMAGMGGMGGGCMGIGGGSKKPAAAGDAGTEMCSAHGRRRTIRNLADDGMGGFRCTPQNQCQGTGGGGMSAGGMSAG